MKKSEAEQLLPKSGDLQVIINKVLDDRGLSLADESDIIGPVDKSTSEEILDALVKWVVEYN